ncbi:hypothetical protein FACS1894189_4210 [Planctomycetales bacterium]|nr:hypothetical protein FACS1894189_4210 [Planctomycetales bacterium]
MKKSKTFPKNDNEKPITFRPKKISYLYERKERGISFRQKTFAIAKLGLGCFMLLWLVGWTVGCVLLAHQVINEPTVFNFLIAFPFWAAWFAVFSFMTATLFGRDLLELDDEGLVYEYRVLFVWQRRKIPLEEIRHFTAVRSTQSDNQHQLFTVEAATFGKPLRFSNVNYEEAVWIAAELNDVRSKLVSTKVSEIVSEIEQSDTEENHVDEPLVIPLNSKPLDIEAPFENRWKLETDFDSLTFRKRGEFSTLSFLICTFLMLFWNGIVSLFFIQLWGLMPNSEQPVGSIWWGLFFFLIPFEVIGLIIIVAWFGTILAPFTVIVWRVEKSQLIKRTTLFGAGFSKTFFLDDAELRMIDFDTQWNLQTGVQTREQLAERFGNRHIVFVDSAHNEICSIPELTLAEAHWIADSILKAR